MYLNNKEHESIQECMEMLKNGCEKLYNECDYSKEFSHFNPPATDEQIAELERKLKFPLPKEYKEFLKFSNGARIMDNDIYGIHEFGMSDHHIPDGYLAIGRNELSGRRIAISEEDGLVYLLWDTRETPWDFEKELMKLLDECEELIDEHDREVEWEKRKKAGVTTEQINEELCEQIRIAKMELAKKKEEEQEIFELYSKLVGEEKAKIIIEERRNRSK